MRVYLMNDEKTNAIIQNNDEAFSNQWGIYMIKAGMSENIAKARGVRAIW